jgi:SPP1 family predicted phage head-tail adaptor
MARGHYWTGAGSLDRQILVQRQQDTQQKDAYGQPVPTPGQTRDGWVTIRTCYAAVEPLGGSERFGASQRLAEADTSFVIRYPLDALPGTLNAIRMTDTILWEGKRYDIVSTQEVGRKERLELLGRLRAGEAG